MDAPTIARIRAPIVHRMLAVATVLALPAWVLGVLASLTGGVPLVALADTALYGWLLAVRSSPRLDASQKAAHLTVILHVIGAMLLFALGPLGHGVMWLTAATVTAAALLSRRAARLAFIAQLVTICLATGMLVLLPPPVFGQPIPMVGWLTFAASSLLLSGALSSAVIQVVEGVLEEVARRERLEAELEQRVADRTADLTAVNRDLERFARAASHDLRSPLTAIDGFATLIEIDGGEAITPQLRGHLDRIHAGVKRMAALIEALMALAGAARAPIRVVDVDISALARSIADELRRAEPGRDVRFSIGEGLAAHGDATLLRVVMENLMRNAWKFTSKKPSATIEIGRRDDAVFVRDDGAGLPPDAGDILFKEFGRLHPATQFPGSGLGLATVARIVERHGGTVWAEGAPGEGATFGFTIPAR